MTVDETARLHLYEQARESWDDDAARTLMASLPKGPEDLVTKALLESKLESTEHKLMGHIDRRIVQLVFAITGVNLTIASVIAIGLQLGR